jgi:hypothetical protein
MVKASSHANSTWGCQRRQHESAQLLTCKYRSNAASSIAVRLGHIARISTGLGFKRHCAPTDAAPALRSSSHTEAQGITSPSKYAAAAAQKTPQRLSTCIVCTPFSGSKAGVQQNSMTHNRLAMMGVRASMATRHKRYAQGLGPAPIASNQQSATGQGAGR